MADAFALERFLPLRLPLLANRLTRMMARAYRSLGHSAPDSAPSRRREAPSRRREAPGWRIVVPLRAGRSSANTIFVVSPLGVEIFDEKPSYEMVLSPFTGRNVRGVVDEAIQWWDRQLQAIESGTP